MSSKWSNILPKKLPKGGTIAITSPSSTPEPERVERGVRYLESLGYRVVVGKTCHTTYHYLAGEDAVRAAELMQFFLDPKIDAIFCARGGYGSMHLLDLLDFDAIAASGKLFVGFSDITALQWALWKKKSMVTVSAGMVATDFAHASLNTDFETGFWKLILEGRIRIPLPPTQEDPETLSGFSLPGTASVAAKLLGSPYAPDFSNAVVILEDVDEPRHKMEGYLQQFKLAGCFELATAVVFGAFTPPATESYPLVPDMDTVLDRVSARAKARCIRGVSYGHIRNKISLPVGAAVSVSLGETSFLKTIGSIFAP